MFIKPALKGHGFKPCRCGRHSLRLQTLREALGKMQTFIYEMPPPTTRELATAVSNMGNLHPSLPVWYKNQQ